MNTGDIIVTPNNDMESYPYTVQRVNDWGVSDGTLVAENSYTDETQYILIEQQNGSNIYRSI